METEGAVDVCLRQLIGMMPVVHRDGTRCIIWAFSPFFTWVDLFHGFDYDWCVLGLASLGIQIWVERTKNRYPSSNTMWGMSGCYDRVTTNHVFRRSITNARRLSFLRVAAGCSVQQLALQALATTRKDYAKCLKRHMFRFGLCPCISHAYVSFLKSKGLRPTPSVYTF